MLRAAEAIAFGNLPACFGSLATHACRARALQSLMPVTLASVPFGFVLVRVFVACDWLVVMSLVADSF